MLTRDTDEPDAQENTVSTRIPGLLGIKYPILQGGMLWIANAELVAAVSNAGGLGILSPYAGMPKNDDPLVNLRDQITATRKLTDNPFAVNIPLDLKQSSEFMDLLIQERIKIVVTAAGNPKVFTNLLKQHGITVMHVVSSVHQAQKAEGCGVDAVIAEGIEAGAHNGADEIPLFSLIPQVSDKVTVPVVAAGGIADARGFTAAMALGAEGIQIGSRFIATPECVAAAQYKQAILDATDTDTMITTRSLVPTRCLKTAFSQTLRELENNGVEREVLAEYIGYRSSWDSQLNGELDQGELFCGASAELIAQIRPAAMIVQELVHGYHRITRSLPDQCPAKKR